MRPSNLDIIKEFEGFRSKPYKDTGNLYTIGYGTIKYPNGVSVAKDDKPITEQQATDFLIFDLARFIKDLNSLIKVEVTQNQFDALCSLIYNIGTTNFSSSTLLRKLNIKDFVGASNEFTKWCKVKGKFSQGLLNRRLKEQAIFNREGT